MTIIPEKLSDNSINFCIVEKTTLGEKNSGKAAIQPGWQKKSIKWNNDELINWINEGGNYGVMGGGDKNLIIVDFDNEEIQNKVKHLLPKTFTVKAGGGLLHKYFFTDGGKSFKILDEEKNTLVDIQSAGKYVVGSGCTHYTGNKYEVVENVEIATIKYDYLKTILEPYNKIKNKTKIETKKSKSDEFVEDLFNQVPFHMLLSEFGVDVNRNPTNCPFHDSVGNACLGWNDEVAHCFHCDESWNKMSWIKKNLDCTAKEAIEWLAKKEERIEELEKSRVEWKKENNKGKMNLTDVIQEILIENPVFYDENRVWWTWDNILKRWMNGDDTTVLNLVRFNSDINTVRYKNDVLEELRQVTRNRKPKEPKKTWVQFKDKVYDIKTGKSFEASPEYFIFNPIPWKIGDSEDTPVIDKLFHEWIVGEVNTPQGRKIQDESWVTTLYEVIAVSMLTYLPFHRIFCLQGEGLNGKGTFLELVYNFIGEHNCTSTSMDALHQTQFETFKLYKKLVALIGELDIGVFRKTALLKAISGGDLVRCEKKRADGFDARLYATPILACNELPATIDESDGWNRRWLIIDFPNRFNEKTKVLEKVPDYEYENLAKKCLRILKEALDRGELTNDGTIEEKKQRFKQRANPLSRYIDEFIEKTNDDSDYITSIDFFEAFNQHSRTQGKGAVTKQSVGRALSQLGFEKVVKNIDDGYGHMKSQQCIVGVKWRY